MSRLSLARSRPATHLIEPVAQRPGSAAAGAPARSPGHALPAASAATTRPRTQRLEFSKRSRRAVAAAPAPPAPPQPAREREERRTLRARRAHHGPEPIIAWSNSGGRPGDDPGPPRRSTTAADVAVERQLLTPERERADRRRRVGADARQVPPGRPGQPSRATAAHASRSPHGAAVVAEPDPLGQHLVDRRRRERRRGRPARQPRLVAPTTRATYVCWSITSETGSRTGRGYAPRQIPRLAGVPAQQPRGARIGGHRRRSTAHRPVSQPSLSSLLGP